MAFGFGMIFPHISRQERGFVVLVCLTIAGFVLSLFTGAYLTADAIAAEKREGTLGLLFLTPLRGWQIVVGKMSMHSLQVGYALLGSFPLFFLPLLLGGVMWGEVVRILLVLLLTLTLSLACGMFYSTVLREVRNAVLATAVTMLLLALLPWLPAMIEDLLDQRASMASLTSPSPMTALIFAFDTKFHARHITPGLAGKSLFWTSTACLAGLSLGLIVLTGWLLPRIWRKSEAGEREIRPAANAKSPRRKRVPKWALPMDQSPLLWLATRDLGEPAWLKWVRGVALIFFAVALLLSACIQNNRHEWFITAFTTAYGLHLVTRTQLLLAATRRLHEDRQSGALEAILVTPVADGDLPRAHHESLERSFRGHLIALFSLNLALELVVILAYDHLDMGHGTWAIFSAFFVGGAALTFSDFAALRWLGLRESLRKQTQLKAVGRVFLWLSVIPWIAFALTFAFAIQANNEHSVGLIFSTWTAACLVYNRAWTAYCRSSLRNGFRQCVAEG